MEHRWQRQCRTCDHSGDAGHLFERARDACELYLRPLDDVGHALRSPSAGGSYSQADVEIGPFDNGSYRVAGLATDPFEIAGNVSIEALGDLYASVRTQGHQVRSEERLQMQRDEAAAQSELEWRSRSPGGAGTTIDDLESLEQCHAVVR